MLNWRYRTTTYYQVPAIAYRGVPEKTFNLRRYDGGERNIAVGATVWVIRRFVDNQSGFGYKSTDNHHFPGYIVGRQRQVKYVGLGYAEKTACRQS